MNICRAFRIALLFSLEAASQPAFSICLPTANAAQNCRFEQGDAWCAEHGKGSRFAFHDGCLKDTGGSPSSGEAILPKDRRWLMIASRPTIEEARTIAESYKSAFVNTAVFSAKNGWYAVTIGDEAYPKAEAVLSELIASGKIPNDSFLATGRNLYRIGVSQEKEPAPKPPIFFVLSQDGLAYPFATVKAGAFEDIRLSTEVSAKDGETHYEDSGTVAVGQSVYLYSGGGSIGSATISRIQHSYDPEFKASCTGSGPDAISLNNLAHLAQGRSAIVATIPVQRSHLQHEIAADEKASAQTLIGELMAKRGFSSAIALELQNRAAIFPVNFRDANGDALVIDGRYDWGDSTKGEDQAIVIFLVAERGRDGEWRLTYTNFYNGAPDGEHEEANFIDHLDLDGDGIDELIQHYNGSEWWGYAVLKWYDSGWREAHKQVLDGC